MIDIVIIGAGGFGREVKCLIDFINNTSNSKQYNILGFLDDGVPKGTKVHEYEVLGKVDSIFEMTIKPHVVMGIGTPQIKKALWGKLKDFEFPSIVHPSVSLKGYNVNLGKGCIICQGVILTCDIEISDFVTINLGTTVGHDTKIFSFASFMPSVNISGEVIIEEGVYVGTGAKIINQLSIGSNTIVGAGAVVSKSLPKDCTAVGIPAKPIKFH